ncbi:MAG TPA: hypothetical protein VGP96_06735 [Candidatus Dormibacteraeota bacterium]|nr:hypothetical protein [Candidatus Dormibacteraeota bacterium]
MTVVRRGVATAAAVLVVALTGCGQPPARPTASNAVPAAVGTMSRPAIVGPSATPSPASSGATSRCTAGEVTATASTDRPAYRTGDPVTLTTTLTNHSAQACSLDVSPRDPAFSVSGGGGEVWRTCGPGQSCPLYERLVTLPAGGSRTETASWNQHTCDASSCQGPPPPAGAYRETASWGDLGSASAPFTVS